MNFLIEPMTEADLAGVMTVQQAAYFDIEPESLTVMRGKFLRSPDTCFVCRRGPELCGYIITYPAHSEHISRLGHLGGEPEADPCSWYVHDLALHPVCKGHGIGRRLYLAARDAAKQLGLEVSHLVAIQGAEYFWQKLGYRICHQISDRARELLRSYDTAALVMSCDLTSNR